MTELMVALGNRTPGKALDLACGTGRHALWLAERGWEVTALDIQPQLLPPPISFTCADLETPAFPIEPHHWDLIVCWLYWQPNLLATIAGGVKPGGCVALAGKTNGRFATSLQAYRTAFPGWTEISAGEDRFKAYWIAVAP